MATVSAKVNPDHMPTVLTMGLGSVVVGHVSHDGMPGLYFCPAMKPSIVDTDAASEVVGKDVPAHAVVIRFATMEAVMAHLQRVEAMMRAFQADLAPTPEQTGGE